MLNFGIGSEVNKCILCLDAPCTKFCDKKINLHSPKTICTFAGTPNRIKEHKSLKNK